MADDKKNPLPPVPVPTQVSQPMWDAANQNKLSLQFDPETNKPQ